LASRGVLGAALALFVGLSVVCLGASPSLAQDLSALRARAETGDAAAQYDLAAAYELGRGVPADLAVAHAWYGKAAAQSHPAANNRLGYLYQHGTGVAQDYERALDYYRTAAKLGDVLAHANLGWLYSYGLGVARDLAEAAKWYRVAAEQGIVWAQGNLAAIYIDRNGGPADDAEAIVWATKAAANRSPFAMGYLGFMHEKGRGVPRDDLKAYIWYRQAVEAGADFYALPLARLTLKSLRPTPPPGLLADREAAQARRDSEESARLAKLTETGALIEADPLLKAHETWVRHVATRYGSDDRSRHEAATWFEKAVASGSTEAMVLLGNLHLKNDWTLSLRDLRHDKPSGTSFVGSALRAAELYKAAADKGSGAAAMTLGALYELGHGVPRDLAAAEAIYRKAIPVMGARAELALLRLTLEEQWKGELWRRDELIGPPDNAVGSAPDSDAIIIEATGAGTIYIRDEIGRRVFEGSLNVGEQYLPPRGQSGLILWTSSSRKPPYHLRVGTTPVPLPEDAANHGIRLDAARLLTGKDFIVGRDDYRDKPRYVPVSTLQGARISIEVLASGNYYYRNEDHTIGYSDFSFKGNRILVPDLPGLTFEMWSRPDDAELARVRISVDGRGPLELTAPRDCLLTLALLPEKLAEARVSRVAAGCQHMTETDAPVPHVTTTVAGEVIGRVQRLLDEKIPGVIADFVPGVITSTVYTAMGAGRWDEALRAQSIGLRKLLRSSGPNALDALEASSRLASIELTTGFYRQGVRRLDDVLRRVREVGELPPRILLPLYETLGSVLATIGRFEEAERVVMRIWRLREQANVEAGRAPFHQTFFVMNRLIGIAAVPRDATKLYILRSLLLKQIAWPDETDEYFHEFASDELVRLLTIFKETGRHDLFAKFLPLTYEQAKFNAGLGHAPEPLTFPLKPFRERVFGGVDHSSLMGDSLSYLAQTYSWSGRHAEALPLYEQWERTNRNVYGPTSIPVANAKAARVHELLMLERVDEALTTAREAFALATAFVDTRSAAARKQSIASIVDPATVVLLEALDAARKPARGANPSEVAALWAESFEVGQRAQYSAAALALQNLGERLSRDNPALAAIEHKRQDLQEKLAYLDVRLVTAIGRGDQAQERELRREIDATESTLAALEGQRTAPTPGRLDIVPADDLVRLGLLGADEALVSLVVTRDATFIWAMANGLTRLVRSELGAEALNRRVGELRCGLDHTLWAREESSGRCRNALGASPRIETVTDAGQDRRIEVLPFDLGRANELYRALLGPIEDIIRDKRLLVIASGPLTSLPFNVLVTDKPERAIPEGLADYRNAAWLGARTTVTVLPSVASLKVLRQLAKTSRASKPYLGVGNPLLDGPHQHSQWGAFYKTQAELAHGRQQCAGAATPQRIVEARGRRSAAGFTSVFRGGRADIETVRLWTPLPETADELCQIGRSLGVPESEILLGANATEAKVKDLSESGQLAQYAILHFATHGALTGQVQGLAEPGLILTPPAKGTTDSKALERDDGFLTASEIATLKLDADWVILSACNTAGGSGDTAEALSGLARAFFHAGARALLVSHWEVNSAAAVKLTTQALAELGTDAGIGRAEALRRSMRGLIGSVADAHPSNWAPFALVGEGAGGR
jgi:TPR repeat protein/CHAT domain-containing protein